MTVIMDDLLLILLIIYNSVYLLIIYWHKYYFVYTCFIIKYTKYTKYTKYLKIIIKKINYLVKIPLPNHTIPLTPTPNFFNKFSWKILFFEDLSTNNLNIG